MLPERCQLEGHSLIDQSTAWVLHSLYEEKVILSFHPYFLLKGAT